LIWLALIIPFIVTIYVIIRYKRKVTLWEIAIPLTICVILIAVCKVFTHAIQTTDIEYWGGCVAQAEYIEDWDKEVPCRHPIYETDSKGNSVFVGYEHVYDVDYYPPQWFVTDSNGIKLRIDKYKFEELAKRFKNRVFVDLHRHYHSKDGDKFVTKWDGSDNTLEPVTTTHYYENRVQASQSVFGYCSVDPKVYGLFKYPKISGYYNCPAILGYDGSDLSQAQRAFNVINSRLGPKRQVRVWVLVFLNQPLQAGFDQENYWQGGNKNEFVITIGINKEGKVRWCHVFSWTKVESLKIETRDYVTSRSKLDLVNLAQWIGPELEKRFVRKHFKDFGYLSVEPPFWMIIIIYIFVMLVSIGTSYWIVKNEFENHPNTL